MPLVRIPDAFDHSEWQFELKHDGFRALAHVHGHTCTLVSRRGHVFTKFTLLADEIAHSVRAMDCVRDGEIVCLDRDCRNRFYNLLFRRDWPYFYAFDLLSIEGQDTRHWPLTERKDRLRATMPRIESRLLFVDSIDRRGCDLFRVARGADLEGIVGKWRHGPYETDGTSTSWVKIKNPTYTQMAGRRELFEARRDRRQARRSGWRQPVLSLRPATAER